MNDLYIFQLPTGSKLLMDSMILLVHRIYLQKIIRGKEEEYLEDHRDPSNFDNSPIILE